MDTSAEVENTKGTASEPTSAVDKLGKLYISCCIVYSYLVYKNTEKNTSCGA